MSQHTNKSGLRPLTQEEVTAVSGGFVVIPALIAIATKIIIESIQITLKNYQDKKDKNNATDPSDPGACSDQKQISNPNACYAV